MSEKFESVLRGVSFRPIEAKEVVRKLEEGQRLTLQRESDNPYDSNAIQVIEPDSEIFIGYVAKEVAMELAPLIDEGREFSVIVSGWMKEMSPILEIEEIS